MRESMLSKVAALLTLVVFVFVSCSSPFYTNVPENPVPIKETPSVPIGQGNLVFAYMDANYRAAAADTGTTALTVTGNELAAGVVVLSQIPNGSPANDNVVRVINTNNNSLVSMFFRPDQPLPYQMAITVGDEDVIGDFSLYNYTAQTFSVSFGGGGENDFYTLSDITMNKDVLTLWNNQSELNSSQNTRIKNMITALCIWESIALQLPDSDFTVTAHSPASRSVTTISRDWWNPFTWKSVREVVTFVLAAVAVVALAVVLVPAIPGMIAAASAGLGVSIPLATTGSVVAGSIAMAATAGAVINETLPEYGVFSAEQTQPAQSTPRVIIRCNGVDAANNGAVYHFPNLNDSMTFDLAFYGVTTVAQPTIAAFDPNFGLNAYNSIYFETPITKNNELHYTIEIKKSAIGFYGDGSMQYIINFDRNLMINGNSSGIMFKATQDAAANMWKNIFIINVSVF